MGLCKGFKTLSTVIDNRKCFLLFYTNPIKQSHSVLGIEERITNVAGLLPSLNFGTSLRCTHNAQLFETESPKRALNARHSHGVLFYVKLKESKWFTTVCKLLLLMHSVQKDYPASYGNFFR